MHPVLLVNNVSEMRTRCEQYLRDADFDVLSAPDAVSAIDMALQTHPATIVIDEGLPRPGAWEVLEVLRKHPALRRIPTLLLGWELECAGQTPAAGANGFVSKPCDAPELVRAVRKLVAMKMGAAA